MQKNPVSVIFLGGRRPRSGRPDPGTGQVSQRDGCASSLQNLCFRQEAKLGVQGKLESDFGISLQTHSEDNPCQIRATARSTCDSALRKSSWLEDAASAR